MRCKVNFVHTVRTIMSHGIRETPPAWLTNWRIIPTSSVLSANKELDISDEWNIIIFTANIRNLGDLADARRPGKTIQTRCPKAQWRAQSASGRRHRSSIPNRRFLRPDDLVQVKYEMLRRVRVDKQSVSQSASAFGFSRPTFYQAEEDFQRDGLSGLLPGSADPVKATNSPPRFWISLSSSARAIRPFGLLDLAAAIQKRFAITAHPRSIERALGRQEKKRR